MFRWGVLCLGFLLIAGVAASLITLNWARGHADALRGELNQALIASELAKSEPARAVAESRIHVANARAELDTLRPAALPIVGISRFFSDLPAGGHWFRTIVALWNMADSGVTLAESSSAAVEELLASLRSGGAGEALVHTAPDLEKRLRVMAESYSILRSARGQLGVLSAPLDSFNPMLQRWDSVAPGLDSFLPTSVGMPTSIAAMLGSDRPRTYLVLVQTIDDLRASGGFITTVGSVRIDRGRIAAIQFQKVYEAEGVEALAGVSVPGVTVAPPMPLQRYMGLGQWLLRDVNWWGDFRATSTQAADFWEILHGERVDGVIALNEFVIEGILEAVGPVTIADGQAVSARNAKDVTLSRVFSGKDAGEWYAAQSVFSQDLAQALIAQSLTMSADRQLALIQKLQDLVKRRELLVDVSEPRAAAMLGRMEADGAIRGGPDDRLVMVEQNVSYGKLSPFLRQDIDYAVMLRGDGKPALVTLTLDAWNTYATGQGLPGYPPFYYDGMRWNPATRQLDTQHGYYGGFTRVYLPQGSSFLGASGFDEGSVVSTERDFTVVGGYRGMGMGAYRRAQLEWVPNVQLSAPGRYRLVVQRQSGAPHNALSVRISLPGGYVASDVSPPPAEIRGSIVSWKTTLDQDRDFQLTLSAPDGGRPLQP